MIEVRKTQVFDTWLKSLKDFKAAAAITRRIARFSVGNFGAVRSIGGGLFEIKVDLGPGYRVYYVTSGRKIVVLLCGGDKSTQRMDIEKAKVLAKALEE